MLEKGKTYIYASIGIGAILLFCSIFMFFMTTCSPLYLDDWHYCNIYPTHQHIESFSDVLKSQYAHYFGRNGRLIPHLIVQTFDGLFDKSVFNFCNSLIFSFFLYISARFIAIKKEYIIYVISLILFLILIGCQGFNEVFLWLSGSCNYLWSAVLAVLFFLVYFRPPATCCLSKGILLFLFGLIVGWTHEGLVLPLACGIVLDVALLRKKTDSFKTYLITGFLFGTALVFFSPGTYSRAIERSTVHSFIIQLEIYANSLWQLLTFSYFIWAVILFLLYNSFRDRKRMKEILCRYRVFLCAIFVSVVFCIIIRVPNYRTVFWLDFYCLFFLLIILRPYYLKMRKPLLLINGLSIVLMIYISNAGYKNLECVKVFEEKVINNEDGIVSIDQLKLNSYLNRFIVTPYYSEYSSFYKGYDPDYEQNMHIARYYNKKSLTFFPSKIAKKMKENPLAFNEFEISDDLPIYLKRVDEGEAISNMRIQYREETFFGNKKIKTKNLKEIDIITINNEHYAVINKMHLLPNGHIIKVTYDN